MNGPWNLDVALSAHKKKLEPERLRRRLLAAGCPKGTASKLVLVVVTLGSDLIKPDDAKSLSTAYELCKSVKQVVSGEDRPLPRALERAGLRMGGKQT